MWNVPEMWALLVQHNAARAHTWMGAFAHFMSKPTVLYANVPEEAMQCLKKVWSKQLRKQIANGARVVNMRLAWLQKLVNSKPSLFRTASKFWIRRKATLKKMIAVFKSLSKDESKILVTGGPFLAQSAAYTRPFCRQVLHTFRVAKRKQAFTSPPIPLKTQLANVKLETASLQPMIRNVEEDYGQCF